MQTREQAEQNLGLGKKVNEQLEELKSIENRLISKLDSFVKELEEKRNLSVSVDYTHKIENIEQVENLNKLLSQHQEIKIKAEDKAIIQGFDGKVNKAIEKINKSLKVPNLAIFLFIGSSILLFASAFFIWNSVKSKQEQYTEFYKQLQEQKAIISKDDKKLFDDMDIWFRQNPKTMKTFIKWRENEKNR